MKWRRWRDWTLWEGTGATSQRILGSMYLAYCTNRWRCEVINKQTKKRELLQDFFFFQFSFVVTFWLKSCLHKHAKRLWRIFMTTLYQVPYDSKVRTILISKVSGNKTNKIICTINVTNTWVDTPRQTRHELFFHKEIKPFEILKRQKYLRYSIEL